MFVSAHKRTAFVVPAVIIGSITVVLAYIIYKRLQHVDMLERQNQSINCPLFYKKEL